MLYSVGSGGDIQLNGEFILEKHCTFINEKGKHLQPASTLYDHFQYTHTHTHTHTHTVSYHQVLLVWYHMKTVRHLLMVALSLNQRN